MILSTILAIIAGLAVQPPTPDQGEIAQYDLATLATLTGSGIDPCGTTKLVGPEAGRPAACAAWNAFCAAALGPDFTCQWLSGDYCRCVY